MIAIAPIGYPVDASSVTVTDASIGTLILEVSTGVYDMVVEEA